MAESIKFTISFRSSNFSYKSFNNSELTFSKFDFKAGICYKELFNEFNSLAFTFPKAILPSQSFYIINLSKFFY